MIRITVALALSLAVFSTKPAQAQVPQWEGYYILTNSDSGGCHPQSFSGDNDGPDGGCCGSPGSRLCTSGIGISYVKQNGCTIPAANAPRANHLLGETGACNLTEPHPGHPDVLPEARPASGTDFTFYSTSDVHFYRVNYDISAQTEHAWQISKFGSTNTSIKWDGTGLTTKGQPSPFVNMDRVNGQSVSTTVAAPTAIIMPGDLTTGSSESRLGAFRLLWEQDWSQSSIKYPVFIGLGNHDIGTGGTFGNSPEGSKQMYNYAKMRQFLFHQDRNPTGCLVNIDSGCTDYFEQAGSLNYSWDWHGVHMVMLNTWAGDRNWNYIPPMGMDGLHWLERDLQHFVGNSKKPVILFQHYNLKKVGMGEWSTLDYHNFWSVIKNYNVIGLFAGHLHYLDVESAWGYAGPILPIDMPAPHHNFDSFSDGSAGDCGTANCSGATSNFLTVHVSDHYMDVGALSWNQQYPPFWDKNIGFRKAGGEASAICRKRINSEYTYADAYATVSIDAYRNFHVVNRSSQSVAGAFALELYKPSQWDFVDSCDPDISDTYTLVTETGLHPGDNVVSYGADVSGAKVVLLNDGLNVSAAAVEANAAPVPVLLYTTTGNAVNFTATADQPWVSIQTSSNTTLATLNITITGTPTATQANITVTPDDMTVVPATIQVNLPTVTFASNVPASEGAHVTVAGTSHPVPAAIPAVPGGTVSVSAPLSFVSSTKAGVRYVFDGWTDGVTTTNRTLNVHSSNPTYTVNYKTQVFVTLTASPTGSGTATGGGWHDVNSILTLTATPANGYYFDGFAGDIGGSANPLTVASVTQPITVKAEFRTDPQVTIDSRPGNQRIYVDNVAYLTPHVFTWAPGEQHSLDATRTNPPAGVRLTFTGWSDKGAAAHQIAVQRDSATVYASFNTSYLLSLSVTGSGSISASPASPTGDGYYANLAHVTLTAAASPANYLTAFGGALSGTTNPQTVNMNGPVSVSASFAAESANTFQVNAPFPGAVAVIDGAATPLPAKLYWIPGTNHTASFPSPQGASAGQQFVFSKWDDGSTSNGRSIVAGVAAATLTGDFIQQEMVTITANPAAGGTVRGAGWYAAGSAANLTANAAGGYAFTGFTGDVQAVASPQSVNVAKPLNVTANFIAAPPNVTVSVSSIDDHDPNTVLLLLSLNNSGMGTAAGLSVYSAVPSVLSGSGSLSVGRLALNPLPVAGGQSISTPLSIAWPTTATRIRLVVNFRANNGAYTGSQTLNLFR